MKLLDVLNEATEDSIIQRGRIIYKTFRKGSIEDTIYNNAAATVTKGQYGLGNISTGYSTSYAFNYYKLNNFVYIDGDYYQHGSTFVKGATTVTVSLSTDCTPL